MRSKTKYSVHDALSILSHLKHKIESPSSEGKRIRDHIRDLGFYISDFGNSFGPEDFDALIQNGIIKINNEKHRTFYEENKIRYLRDQTVNSNKPHEVKGKIKSLNKDEHYVLDLCDEILERTGSRQHKFDFLEGDPNKNGTKVKLPVDIYYDDLNLVIEYKEKQHSEEVQFFDKPNRMTVSGVSRGEQRKIYDQRRRDILPQHGITLIEIDYSKFEYDNQKRILRSKERDIERVKIILKKYL